MPTPIKTAMLAAATLGLGTAAVPASAATAFDFGAPTHSVAAGYGDDGWRGRDYRDRDYRDRDYGDRRYYRDRYDDRGYQGRTWRGRDGRYYCRRDDGTTGLLIGGAVGGLIGHEVAGRGDRTLGAILGAAGGALLGRSIDRSNTRCR